MPVSGRNPFISQMALVYMSLLRYAGQKAFVSLRHFNPPPLPPKKDELYNPIHKKRKEGVIMDFRPEHKDRKGMNGNSLNAA